MKSNYTIYLLLSVICGICRAEAQSIDVQLANQYLLNGEKEKAYVAYKELAKNQNNIPFIHTNYFNLLLEMKKTKEAENYLEKLIRSSHKSSYCIDLAYFYLTSGQADRGDKYLKDYIASIARDVGSCRKFLMS